MGTIGQVLSLFGAIIGLAIVTVAVTSPNTSNILSAFGSTFSSSLKIAMGR